MRFPERGEFGHGVRIVGRIVENRRLLERRRSVRSKKVPVLSATTPSHAMRLAGVEHVGGADHVDGLEVVDVLARATEQRRAVDGRLAALRPRADIGGVGDVALDEFDTDSWSAAASSGFRTSARTSSPRSMSCSQTLAPVSPVPPVTKMVWPSDESSRWLLRRYNKCK